jgi:hypothetical protein
MIETVMNIVYALLVGSGICILLAAWTARKGTK